MNFTSATSDGLTHGVTPSSFTFAGKGDFAAFSLTSLPCNSSRVLWLNFLRQNEGRLLRRARENEFADLTADEVSKVEEWYTASFGTAGAPGE